MKKRYTVLLVVAAFIVGMMAGGAAMADTPITVWINGKQMVSDQTPVIINDRVFVPLRAVSESLGASVGWNYWSQSVFIATPGDPEDIEIIGTDEFKKTMKDSLELLKEKAPDDYAFIGMYTKKIETDTGVLTYPHAGIYNMTTYIPPEAFTPDIYWCAGILRHEAQHSYQTYRANNDVSVTEPEAYQAELNTLIKIDAPHRLIERQQKFITDRIWQN